MAAAIRAAETVSRVSEKVAREFAEEKPNLERFPLSRKIFLGDGQMLKAVVTLRQPELAATLKRIAKNGAADLYRCETAPRLFYIMANAGWLMPLFNLPQPAPQLPHVPP